MGFFSLGLKGQSFKEIKNFSRISLKLASCGLNLHVSSQSFTSLSQGCDVQLCRLNRTQPYLAAHMVIQWIIHMSPDPGKGFGTVYAQI